MGRVLPIAILLSGEGTTFDSIAEAIAGGHLPARIVVVVSDRPHAHGIERARYRGLPTAVRPLHGIAAADWARDVGALLTDRGAELVVLAGFLGILPREFLAPWRGRVINVHPSLLPKFGGPGMYGRHVHEAVLAARSTESGASIHVVTEEVDGGPVLLQEKVPVEPGDTSESLQDRIRPVERRLLADAIRRFADGEWPLPYDASGKVSPSREPGGRSP